MEKNKEENGFSEIFKKVDVFDEICDIMIHGITDLISQCKNMINRLEVMEHGLNEVRTSAFRKALRDLKLDDKYIKSNTEK